MAHLKWSDGPAEIILMVIPRPQTGRVSMEVALTVKFQTGPVTVFNGASYLTHKHPADKHDPFEGIKFALPKVMAKMNLNKRARTQVWEQLRTNFPAGKLLSDYGRAFYGPGHVYMGEVNV